MLSDIWAKGLVQSEILDFVAYAQSVHPSERIDCDCWFSGFGGTVNSSDEVHAMTRGIFMQPKICHALDLFTIICHTWGRCRTRIS